MSFFSFLGKLAIFNMIFKRQSWKSSNESRQCRYENTDYLGYRDLSSNNYNPNHNHSYSRHDYDYDDFDDYHDGFHDVYDDIMDDDY